MYADIKKEITSFKGFSRIKSEPKKIENHSSHPSPFTHFRLRKNTEAFEAKRLGVSIETLRRFGLNSEFT